ncbi:MAG TPA: VOC family protein [Acidimicrobiales bacterium]|nr:VOC family protein [Acidimicrobiales bacterium]
MAKLRHLALATDDPDATAQFYMDVFEFEWVRKAGGDWGYGHILTDGTMNLAVLRFTSAAAAGVEKGTDFAGLHHIGFEVDDVEEASHRVQRAGGTARPDISEGLGIKHDGSAKGELKYEGPDGVLFDLSQAGFWQFAPRETSSS